MTRLFLRLLFELLLDASRNPDQIAEAQATVSRGGISNSVKEGNTHENIQT